MAFYKGHNPGLVYMGNGFVLHLNYIDAGFGLELLDAKACLR